MPRHCVRMTMPDGSAGIVCGDFRDRIICDVCDAPVPKGAPKFDFRGKKVDLCTSCQDNRARGDPEWRRFAESAMAHNLGIHLGPPV